MIRSFYDFLKFSENLLKCLEMIRKFANLIGTVWKHSLELKSFGAGFKKSSKGHHHNYVACK